MRIQDYMLETPTKMKEIISKSDELFKEIVKQDINKIIITGSGTSYHSGVQVQTYLQGILDAEVTAMYPFMITKDTFKGKNEKTLIIGISQGGSSYSTYNAMKVAKECGCITASMAGCENALIDEAADYILTVYCGEEKAGAKTKGFYCTKLNLMLLGLKLGKENGQISEEKYKEEIDKILDASDRFEEVYKKSEQWIEKNKSRLVEAKEIRIIGPAELYGDTLESALKLLETMRVPVTGYEFEEFIHGIYNAINSDSTIFILDTGKEPRVAKMIEVLSEWTSNIYVIGRNVASDDRNLQINVSEDEHHQTFNFIVPMQLICGEIPNLRGVNPSIPKDPQFHMKLGSKRFNK
ncbi:SIS domain-containing protein [Clostridium beijerinckii]|uniref:SIS domain-containing protein n=1 Tax=Clostridium beijerinckii TaxID=1520 RepID=UPI00156EA36C|nr:SIS domain-containing protein [Clostridium beijerinckii]NRT70088.1 glucosamine 6-phosphate synthetase-like amidotransferase/phosphosugar isomerase protein [Clostridium beijerinckii]